MTDLQEPVKLLSDEYVAGLFDGEGCITYKQYMRKRKHQKKAYPTWSIRMEMAMTDESVNRRL